MFQRELERKVFALNKQRNVMDCGIIITIISAPSKVLFGVAILVDPFPCVRVSNIAQSQARWLGQVKIIHRRLFVRGEWRFNNRLEWRVVLMTSLKTVKMVKGWSERSLLKRTETPAR